MSEKMTVLFIKDTGQVVAALTREADPESQLTAAVLGGETLGLRYAGDLGTTGYGVNEFLLKAEELEALVVDFDDGVIRTPRGFVVNKDKKIQPANTVTTVTPSLPNLSQVQVVVGAAVTEETKVRVELIEMISKDRQVVTSSIPAAGTQKDIALRPLQTTLSYDVLTLVQGFELDRRILNAP